MPNAKILEQKQAVVCELTDKFQNAKAGVLVDYKGITVELDTKLRKQMREAGVEYGVVKNTLTLLAAKQAGLNEMEEFLNGTTSLAISLTDPVAPAKVLGEFLKQNQEAFQIKVGFVEGKVIDKKQVEELSELPSKEVLVAKALGGLNAPITGFVTVLHANLKGLAVVLQAISEKKANV